MEQRLLAIANKLWPELETMGEMERTGGVYDVLGVLYSVPLALVGFVWLVAITDLSVIRPGWPALLLLFVMLLVLEKLDFFFFVEAQPGVFAHFSGSFEGMITWSAALLFGPTVLWMAIPGHLFEFIRTGRRAASAKTRWSAARNFALNITNTTLVSLISLVLYQRMGGIFPLPGLTLDAILPAFYATLVHFLLSLLIYAPLMIYIISKSVKAPASARDASWTRVLITGLVTVLGSGFLVELYAILAAGLHALNGPVYFFFITGVLIVSWLAYRLSQAVERSQQRSRELSKLEELGRAILAAPPDASTLPDVLREHARTMFSRSRIEIRLGRSPLFPNQSILHYPDDWPPVGAPVWEWQHANTETRHFAPKSKLPWGEQLDAGTALVLAPILDAENSEPLGGIYLSRGWDTDTIASLMPAVQSLAAQIAAALHRAQVYQIEQEMAVAGKIQASFLPDSTPRVPGWQLAATLEPARETSGDFYDFIPLPDGRLGILIADVADKGTGAALYMAASRTLIRTYAAEYDTQPELALDAANRRLLTDTRADLFVTVFYGILDSTAGTLTYCNAGHNPPYLLNARNGGEAQALTKTGMALGVITDTTWGQRTVHFASGDLLVLYTDGVTDAEDEQGAFFGEQRMLETVHAHRERPAQDVHDTLLSEVHQFVGDAPQFDDITLMVVVREQ